MSIFGKIKGAKKAADQKKAQGTEQKPPSQPYRHIPTHAAIDALGGAPPGHNAEDTAAIKAAHRDRRQRISRQSSMLSTATPMTRGDSFQSAPGLGQRRPRSQFQSMHNLLVPESSSAANLALPRSQGANPPVAGISGL